MILQLPREAKLACIEYVFSQKIREINMKCFDSLREKLFKSKSLKFLTPYNNGYDSYYIEKDSTSYFFKIFFQTYDDNGVSWTVIVEYVLDSFSEDITQILAIDYKGYEEVIEI